MTKIILAQHSKAIKHNQVNLDKFKAKNPDISHVSSRKLIYGIGVNDANYVVNPKINGKRVTCIFYETWTGMIKRCYYDKYQDKYPTYIGCIVTNEWHSFMAFKSWMETQDYENKQLDKDLLFIGKKVYSPETCIFVTCQVNVLLNDNAAARGDYPLGVSFYKEKYVATVGINNKQKYLGRFNTPREAESAYVKAKTANIIKIALEQNSSKLMKALIMQASYMRVNFECNAANVNPI